MLRDKAERLIRMFAKESSYTSPVLDELIEKKAKMKKKEEAQSREGEVWYDDDDKKRREEDADWIQDSGTASCCRSVGKVCESRGRGRAERQSSWLRKKAGKETKETTFDRSS